MYNRVARALWFGLCSAFRSPIYTFTIVSLLSFLFSYTFLTDITPEEHTSAAEHVNQTVTESLPRSFGAMLHTYPCVRWSFGYVCLGSIVIAAQRFFPLFFNKLQPLEIGGILELSAKFSLLRTSVILNTVFVTSLNALCDWMLWYSALGVLHVFIFLAFSRCAKIFLSRSVSRKQWAQMVSFILLLLVGNTSLLYFACKDSVTLSGLDPRMASHMLEVLHGQTDLPEQQTVLSAISKQIFFSMAPINLMIDVLALLLCEILLTYCLIFQFLFGLLIQLIDRWYTKHGLSWPQHRAVVYYTELAFSLTFHLTELAHYVHLLIWSRFLSMACIIVFTQIRSTYILISQRTRRHVGFRRLKKFIQRNYPLCTKEYPNGKPVDEALVKSTSNDSENTKALQSSTESDMCMICWEPLIVWRRLPCKHDVHESCLQAWLEQDPSCPSCRCKLAVSDVVDYATQLPNSPETNDYPGRNLHPSFIGMRPPFTQAPPSQALPIWGQLQNLVFPNFQSATENEGRDRLFPNDLFTTAVGFNIGINTVQGNQEPPSHVHRRTFYFNRSHAWRLPSVHFEFSEMFNFTPRVPNEGGPASERTTTGNEEAINRLSTGGNRSASNSSFASLFRRFVSVFPSPQPQPLTNAERETLEASSRQIGEMFPNISIPVIMEDLVVTRSSEITVERILAGLITAATPTASQGEPSADSIPRTSAAAFYQPQQEMDEPASFFSRLAQRHGEQESATVRLRHQGNVTESP